MASERQLEANRRNGRKGGPKTEAGKQRSRLNSLQHGLTSSTLVVLPEENQQEYEEVLRALRESLQPHDATEDMLVVRLAQTHWRGLRSRRLETGMLHITADTERARAREIVEDCPKHLNPHNAIAVPFMTRPPDQWHTWLRYDTAISRDFFRTLDTLTKLQRVRQTKAPAKAMAVGQAVSPAILTNPLSDSGIRSVSQNEAPKSCSAPAAREEPVTSGKTAIDQTSAIVRSGSRVASGIFAPESSGGSPCPVST